MVHYSVLRWTTGWTITTNCRLQNNFELDSQKSRKRQQSRKCRNSWNSWKSRESWEARKAGTQRFREDNFLDRQHRPDTLDCCQPPWRWRADSESGWVVLPSRGLRCNGKAPPETRAMVYTVIPKRQMGGRGRCVRCVQGSRRARLEGQPQSGCRQGVGFWMARGGNHAVWGLGVLHTRVWFLPRVQTSRTCAGNVTPPRAGALCWTHSEADAGWRASLRDHQTYLAIMRVRGEEPPAVLASLRSSWKPVWAM